MPHAHRWARPSFVIAKSERALAVRAAVEAVEAVEAVPARA